MLPCFGYTRLPPALRAILRRARPQEHRVVLNGPATLRATGGGMRELGGFAPLRRRMGCRRG